MRRSLANPAVAVAVACGLLTSACSKVDRAVSSVTGFLGGSSSAPQPGQQGYVKGFIGAVVADEPRAALAGREVLSAGGNAADAAVAMGLTLAVTLPSRAGLGAGGACLAMRGDERAAGVPDAILFLPPAGAASGAERPAAAPMLARGLFLLSVRHGRMRFEGLLTAAEQLAREGVETSRALARDVAAVAGPLAGDPAARAIFMPGGRPIAEGDRLVQPELGGTLAEMRRAGVGSLYQGALSQQFLAGADRAGGGLTAADLKAALPAMVPALMIDRSGGATLSFLPPPADGGLAAAAAYQVLASDPADLAGAKARALGAAAEYRRTRGDPQAILRSGASGSLPPLPASTSFAVVDREGNAVVCAESMGNLFGTGRMAGTTGILLGASPAWLPPPLLSAGMLTYRRSSMVKAVVGGSGQDGAPVAVALALARAMAESGRVAHPDPGAAPEPGRANVIACTQGPKEPNSCAWATDPRGFGLATGSN
jgi:gamma-glutamyltranspeptidase/glutathione hydrolase